MGGRYREDREPDSPARLPFMPGQVSNGEFVPAEQTAAEVATPTRSASCEVGRCRGRDRASRALRGGGRDGTPVLVALLVALMTAVALSACGPSDEASGPPIDAGIQRVALIGERPGISAVLVDDDGCVIAGTTRSGAGSHSEVWTGADCVSVLQSADGMTGATGPGPGAWTDTGRMTMDKTIIGGVVRTIGDTGVLVVGYVEERSDLFPTSARIFTTGADPQLPDAPDEMTIVVEGGVLDPDGVVLNDVERAPDGRLIVAGARRIDGGSTPRVWWSDDELGVMHEVELSAPTGGWSDAEEIFIRPDGRMLVSGSRSATASVFDDEGAVWISDDSGASWQEATHDGSFAGPVMVVVREVVETSEGLVAVGFSYGGGMDEQPLMWQSDDGTSWSRSEEGPSLDGPGALMAVIAEPDGDMVIFGGTIEAPAEKGRREPEYLGYAWEQTADGWNALALGDERPYLAASSGDGWVAIGPRSLWSKD